MKWKAVNIDNHNYVLWLMKTTSSPKLYQAFCFFNETAGKHRFEHVPVGQFYLNTRRRSNNKRCLGAANRSKQTRILKSYIVQHSSLYEQRHYRNTMLLFLIVL